jgi:hypothetical protein
LADGATTFTKRRTGFFVGDDAEGFFLNDVGVKLFDAAVAWTANKAMPASLLQGDANGDGKATFSDYKTWGANTATGLPAFNFGSGGQAQGNFNYDNVVNLTDRALWESNWMTGDLTNDQVVGSADVSQVAASWGATYGASNPNNANANWGNGDASLNGKVDIFDLAVLSAHWTGPAVPVSESSGIAAPEPTGAQIFLGLGAALSVRPLMRRRRSGYQWLRRIAPAAGLLAVALAAPRPAGALDILVVTGDAPDPGNPNRMIIVGDQAIVNRLQNVLGATVTTIDQDYDPDGVEGPLTQRNYMRDQAVGKDLVILTRNVSPGNFEVQVAFATQDVPVLLFHDDLLDDYSFAGAEGGDGYTNKINITGSGNILTAGIPNGNNLDFYVYNNFRQGGTDNIAPSSPEYPNRMPTEDAITAAVRTNSSLRFMIFGYDHGSTMANGFTNVGRRTFFGTHALSTPYFMTPMAWTLFDRAVLWTADQVSVFSVPEPGSLGLLAMAGAGVSLLDRMRRRSLRPRG